MLRRYFCNFFPPVRTDSQKIHPNRDFEKKTANLTDQNKVTVSFSTTINTKDTRSTSYSMNESLAMPKQIQPIEFLEQRGLTKNNCELYATEMRYISTKLQTLLALTDTEQEETLNVFNTAFNKIPIVTIPSRHKKPIYTDFGPVGQNFVDSLRYEALPHSQTVAESNLIAITIAVYDSMNHYRQRHHLIYHQPWHPSEVLKDLHYLLQLNPEKYASWQWIAQLSAITHDAIYTGTRITDEKASYNFLINLLEPILQTLAPTHRAIIEAKFYSVINGGSIPCFLTMNKFYQPQTNITNLGALAVEFMCINDPSIISNIENSTLIELMHLFGIVDTQRTSLPCLFAEQNLYNNRAWKKLMPFLNEINPTKEDLLSEQLKLTQCFKVLFETNGNLLTLAKRTASYQQGDTSHASDYANFADSVVIATLANALQKEIGFATLMHHSFQSNLNRTGHGYFKVTDLMHDNWLAHAKVLQKLHRYLTDSTCGYGEKLQLALTFSQIAADQSGTQFTIEDIHTICQQTLASIAIEKAAATMNHEQLSAAINTVPLQDNRALSYH